jgi:glycosyltransferase involved in cell wall biosynthesis
MRILFLDTSSIRRGAQVFIAELADALQEHGLETIRMYLYKVESGATTVPIRKQDKVLGFDSSSFLEKVPTLQPALLRQLATEINSMKPDIVLLNGSRTLKYGAALKRLYPIKAKFLSRIIDNAEFWNTGKFTHWYYKNLVIPQVDASIGVSQASLASMIRHYDFKKPTAVIHRVFDPNKFKNAPSREAARRDLGLEEADEVLLFLGNLTAQKRPDRFIDIIQKLAQTRPNLKALIVGDGPLRQELEKQVVSPDSYRDESQESKEKTSDIRHLTPYILFTGYQQEVSPFLAAADILVLTSDTEGLPGVVLEAAHFGVSTVATEVGGIKECLIDGETGFLIPDRSVAAFSTRLDTLLADPSLRAQLGMNAKKFTTQHFQMDKVAQQYLDFFRQILNHP